MSKHATESLGEVHASVNIPKNKGLWRKLFAFLGPAYLVSVGYMDPGNWATDIAGGSQFGYRLLWVLLMSNLIALLLQSLSARLGVVRGMDLAQASRNAYPKFINIPLYVLAEIAIAATDLAEVIGMAIGIHLLFGLPLIWGVLITIFDTLLLLFLLNKGIRIMEAFILSLVFIIGMSFLAEMAIVKPAVSEVLKGFEPSMLGGNALYIAIGIIGATVMPHNLYLHSSLVQTRKIERTFKDIKDALKYNFIDSAIALNLAFLVNSAILILAAAAFYRYGFHEVADIQDAHRLLQNIFGTELAPALFAIALIAAGQSSTITGTLSGQIVMEGYLNLRIRPWLRRMLTRMIAIIPALITIIYFGEESLGSLLVLSQVILSLQLGFAVIPLIHFVSDKSKMKEFVIKPWVKILAWLSASIIVALNVKLVVEQISQWLAGSGDNLLIWFLVLPLAILVGLLLIYVIVNPYIRSELKPKSAVPHGQALEFELTEDVKYRRMAVTIDFSENDSKTIQHALALGGKDAEFLLVHIVESAGARYLGNDIRDLETITDIENLKKYADNIQALGYQANYKVGFGDPTKSIPEIIHEFKADCLVMGAHGHKGLKDVIFGATVDSVRHKVKIPVLIVR